MTAKREGKIYCVANLRMVVEERIKETRLILGGIPEQYQGKVQSHLEGWAWLDEHLKKLQEEARNDQ